MKLKPIKRPRLSQSAVNQIRDYIRNESLKPGTKLPSERKLMEDLQISRNSIREALRILEAMGIVDVKPGKGSFVSSDAIKKAPFPEELWEAVGSESINNIFEARLLFEPGAAQKVAEIATERQIRAIEDLVFEMKEKLDLGDIPGAIIADAEMHKLIVKTTGNSTLVLFMDVINRALFQEWEESLEMPGRMASTLDEHKKIVEKLKERDGDGAETAMREHLERAVARYKNWDPRGKQVATS